MNEKEAIIILREHNAWRRGDRAEMANSPYEIGQAIDIVLESIAEKQKKIRSLRADNRRLRHLQKVSGS